MIEAIASVGLETWILIACSAIGLFAISKWHNDDSIKFDLKTIVLDDKGNFSVYHVAQLLALFTSTWIIIYQTRHGALTEWVYTGYMVAWAGMGVAGKWMDAKNNQSEGK